MRSSARCGRVGAGAFDRRAFASSSLRLIWVRGNLGQRERALLEHRRLDGLRVRKDAVGLAAMAEDEAVRWQSRNRAIRLLGKLGDRRASQALQRLARAEPGGTPIPVHSTALRVASVMALQRLGSSDTEKALVDLLADEEPAIASHATG
jgi:HEAT repeat protein